MKHLKIFSRLPTAALLLASTSATAQQVAARKNLAAIIPAAGNYSALGLAIQVDSAGNCLTNGVIQSGQAYSVHGGRGVLCFVTDNLSKGFDYVRPGGAGQAAVAISSNHQAGVVPGASLVGFTAMHSSRVEIDIDPDNPGQCTFSVSHLDGSSAPTVRKMPGVTVKEGFKTKKTFGDTLCLASDGEHVFFIPADNKSGENMAATSISDPAYPPRNEDIPGTNAQIIIDHIDPLGSPLFLSLGGLSDPMASKTPPHHSHYYDTNNPKQSRVHFTPIANSSQNSSGTCGLGNGGRLPDENDYNWAGVIAADGGSCFCTPGSDCSTWDDVWTEPNEADYTFDDSSFTITPNAICVTAQNGNPYAIGSSAWGGVGGVGASLAQSGFGLFVACNNGTQGPLQPYAFVEIIGTKFNDQTELPCTSAIQTFSGSAQVIDNERYGDGGWTQASTSIAATGCPSLSAGPEQSDSLFAPTVEGIDERLQNTNDLTNYVPVLDPNGAQIGSVTYKGKGYGEGNDFWNPNSGYYTAHFSVSSQPIASNDSRTFDLYEIGSHTFNAASYNREVTYKSTCDQLVPGDLAAADIVVLDRPGGKPNAKGSCIVKLPEKDQRNFTFRQNNDKTTNSLLQGLLP